MGKPTDRDSELSREAKVGELQLPAVGDEYVLWFDVAVEDAVQVAVADARHELEGVPPHRFGGEPVGAFRGEELLEVLLKVPERVH